jgi:UDP-3-O-acyl-N-acetylglucosamine deacetylase
LFGDSLLLFIVAVCCVGCLLFDDLVLCTVLAAAAGVTVLLATLVMSAITQGATESVWISIEAEDIPVCGCTTSALQWQVQLTTSV